MEWLIIAAVVAVVLAGQLLTSTAGRVDRLHHRVEKSRAVMDAALFHRSGTALEIASAGLLDPATSMVLLDAAHEARAATGEDRMLAESNLSRALVAVLESPELVAELRSAEGPRQLLDELATACRSVELSRRFHNDLVASARALRRRRVVRWFGLAGHAPWPDMVELDDSWPQTLG